jgi:RHS repeat-associated protein
MKMKKSKILFLLTLVVLSLLFSTSFVYAQELSQENTIGFTGQDYFESVELYLYPMRAYSPETGRFLQRDPSGYVDGENLYEYVSGNALSSTDAMGLQVSGESAAILRRINEISARLDDSLKAVEASRNLKLPTKPRIIKPTIEDMLYGKTPNALAPELGQRVSIAGQVIPDKIHEAHIRLVESASGPRGNFLLRQFGEFESVVVTRNLKDQSRFSTTGDPIPIGATVQIPRNALKKMEVAKILRVSQTQVHNLIGGGKYKAELAHVRLGIRNIRILPQSVVEYISPGTELRAIDPDKVLDLFEVADYLQIGRPVLRRGKRFTPPILKEIIASGDLPFFFIDKESIFTGKSTGGLASPAVGAFSLRTRVLLSDLEKYLWKKRTYDWERMPSGRHR